MRKFMFAAVALMYAPVFCMVMPDVMEKSDFYKVRMENASNGEWRSLGNATMQDGWFMPLFGFDFTRTHRLSCEMLESESEPGLYRLVNPYDRTVLEEMGIGEYNLNDTPADIYIDAIDPDYIIVQGQYSGWTFPGGIVDDIPEDSPVYIGSANAFMENYGMTMDVVQAMCYGGKIKDGVITVRGCVWGLNEDEVPGSVWSSRMTMFDTRIALPGYDVGYEWEKGKWEYAGTAMFTDGWLAPGCGEYGGMAYEVAVERDVENEGVYRLVEPFTCSLSSVSLAGINENKNEDGLPYYLWFDMSDPENVIIPVQPSGVMIEGLEILPANYVAYLGETFNWNYDYAAQQLVSELGYGEDYVSKVKDNIVTVNAPAYAVPGTFRYENYWGGSPFVPARIDMSDVLCGIENISDEFDDNQTVEYYNMEGLRVTSPASGSMVICRQGSAVKKIIVK